MGKVVKNDFHFGVECFAEANKKYWAEDSNPANGDGWIYVLHTLHSEFTLSVLEDIVAKGVQGKKHLPMISVISGRADEMVRLMAQVDASFGIQKTLHPSYYDYSSEEIEQLAKKMSSNTYGDKDGLIGLTYRGIRFGDVLYDDMLRRGNNKKRGDVLDCFDVSQERYRSFIRNALAIIDQAYEMFAERRPKYLITAEYFYTKGLYAYVACALGAKILVASVTCPDIIVQINPDEHQLADVVLADIMRVQMEKCLLEYQKNNDSAENFFMIENERREEEEEVFQKLSNGKKNVVILPHAFGDSPRESSRQHIYHDYFEWYLDTIRIVRNIPNVNWIFKDHPWSSYYKQGDYVWKIFENNKTENMYWLSADFDGISIKGFADCILTCAGTAGIEYWAYGIPTITTGEAAYCSWGISYQMKSLKEYENTLKNIEEIKKPSEESSKLAGMYLSAYKNWSKTRDDLVELLIDFRSKEVSVLKETGNPYGITESTDWKLGEVVRSFCTAFSDFLQKKELKQSSIYCLNNLVIL